MMNEIKPNQNSEVKMSESERFKEIKPENGMDYTESKQYWNKEFAEIGNQSEKIYFDDNGKQYREGDSLTPDNRFEKNRYEYQTDEAGRVVSVEGKLQVKDHNGRYEMPDDRNVVAHGEMKSSDDRGHFIADRFNGSGELENLVPMDRKLNQGDYAKLEDTLAEAVNDGADVRMKVEPVYDGDSNRPTEIRVSYSIDGDKEVVVFKNGSED